MGSRVRIGDGFRRYACPLKSAEPVIEEPVARPDHRPIAHQTMTAR